MIRLASVCKDNALRQDTGYAKEDDLSAWMVDEVESVGVGFVDFGASSSEPAVLARSVNICRTLLNNEVLGWRL